MKGIVGFDIAVTYVIYDSQNVTACGSTKLKSFLSLHNDITLYPD